MRLFLLRWFIGWCTLVEGIIDVCTFGLFDGIGLCLWAEKQYSDARLTLLLSLREKGTNK